MKSWIITILKNFFFSIFPLIVVFIGSLYAPSDSDMGWHLAYGEYFFKHFNVLRQNTFSLDMPGYHWINSSWATDLITYATFTIFGFAGISILSALVITALFYFFSISLHLSFWEKAILFPILLYFETPLFNVSFRGQLLTLLFISILSLILSRFASGKKHVLWFVLPLFTLWSNFHGQFILGLGLLVTFFTLYMVQKWRQKERCDGKFLFLIFILSLTATLIHPFGIGIYEESLRHFGNPLQKYIIEWLPFDTFSTLWWHLVIWDGVVLITLYILYREKKLTAFLPSIGLSIILLISSSSVRRYFWSALLISLPLIRYFVKRCEPKSKTISFTIAVFVLFLSYLYGVFIQAPLESVFHMDWNRYCYQYVGCSPKALEFLQREKLPGKRMTFYNWGGWLISQYPDIKPSIDGRMHLWRDKSGYSAFEYYYPIEQNWTDVDKSSYDIVLMTPKKPVYRRLLELVKEKKWVIAYQDDFAAIFIRSSRYLSN